MERTTSILEHEVKGIEFVDNLKCDMIYHRTGNQLQSQMGFEKLETEHLFGVSSPEKEKKKQETHLPPGSCPS